MKAACILSLVFLMVLRLNAQTEGQDKVYTFVEHNPEFPGGDAALTKFVFQNIHWPPIDSTVDLNGKILVRFVVNTDGSTSNITLIRPVNVLIEKEIKRVIQLLPKFKPGMQDGKAVKVYFNLPFNVKYQ